MMAIQSVDCLAIFVIINLCIEINIFSVTLESFINNFNCLVSPPFYSQHALTFV